ncbi:MAG: hypothetical protein WA667_29240 [Candidatus Nitrosopolaris sp.]
MSPIPTPSTTTTPASRALYDKSVALQDLGNYTGAITYEFFSHSVRYPSINDGGLIRYKLIGI